MNKEQELKKEIERCDKAKDGDLHFSKSNWDLREQFCKGELKGYQEAQKEFSSKLKQLKKDFIEYFNKEYPKKRLTKYHHLGFILKKIEEMKC